MIILDASAAVLGLSRHGDARAAMQSEDLHAPHLIDAELLNAFRRGVRRGTYSDVGVRDALSLWSLIGIRRHAMDALLPRMWAWRNNLTAYDAAYVVLAEMLGCALITSDRHIAAAPGVRIEVVSVTT